MTTLTLDDATYAALAARAESAGLTVERWLAAEFTDEDAANAAAAPDPGHLRGRSLEEWNREFDAFLASMKPRNPNLDDSRESIYPVRP